MDPMNNSVFVIGGAVGGVALLLIIGLVIFVCSRKTQVVKQKGMCKSKTIIDSFDNVKSVYF